MTSLRKEARSRDCQIRISGICNHDSATTVLAHFRMAGISGMGMKSPDVIGSWACSACHQWVDTHKDDETQLDFAHGVFRTQAILAAEGKIRW